jgi:excisionase family DNA binding protein
MNDKLLTRPEVQQILRISTTKMFRLIKNQELPVIKIGNTYRIKQTDLEHFIHQHQRGDMLRMPHCPFALYVGTKNW